MKILSVKQPWAWLIVHGLKDVENRSWSTPYRGIIYIHAGKTRMSLDDWQYLKDTCQINDHPVPKKYEIAYGGIIGSVTLVNCVRESGSEWFDGPIGWELQKPAPCRFIPMKGKLGLYEVEL